MSTDQRDLVIALSKGGSLKKLWGSKNRTVSWPELVELLSTCHEDDLTREEYLQLSIQDQGVRKNHLGAFVGGSFSNGRRNSDSIEFRSVVTLDIDTASQDIWQDICLTGSIPALNGLAYQVHTTRKHTEAAPRLRVVIPLSRDVTPEEYVPIMCGVAEMVDPTMRAVSVESFVAVQVMFLPTKCSDGDFYCMHQDGEFLNPKPILKKYKVDKPETWPKPAGDTAKPFSRLKIVHPEDKKAMAPIITAVHRAYHPRTFIDEFLDDVYVAAGDRYFPVGATGAPSVRIYEDAFVQSDHGSDPARGQHNTFDLGRIHLFGDLDEDFDTESMPLAEWPSFKAMTEWALKQDEVADAYAEILEEVESERNQDMLDSLDEIDDEPEEDEPAEIDLIGAAEDDDEPKKKGVDVEKVLAKVKRSIARASSLNDLENRVEKIRALPIDGFRELHRDLVAPDLQKKFLELTGEKITKANARKMLAPTVENLRKQVEGQDLPDWLAPWIYLSQDNKFMHLGTKELLPREGFNARFMVQAGEQFGTSSLGTPKVSAADIAWSIYDIAKPYTTRFVPGAAELFEENGCLYANTYRRPVVESGGYKGKEGVKLLKRLLEDLFPERSDREKLMDFLVHCVRFPEKKLKYAVLVKGAENEGKSLLADLVAKLVGDDNCSVINTDILKEKYTGWVYEKLFCTIEEVKVPGREVEEVLNKLKPITTNDRIPVRRMQKDATRERNFCNLYLTTNDDDALRIDIDNTRYMILFTRFRTNSEVVDWHAELKATEGRVYVRDLWEHIHHRPAQFLEAFAKYQFSEFYDPEGRAPMTRFKARMAEDGKSEERTLLEDLLATGGVPGVSDDLLLWSAFKPFLDEKGIGASLQKSAVAKFLKPFGFVRAAPFSTRVDGKVVTYKVWTRNLSLLDSENQLHPEAKTRALAEIDRVNALDDPESLISLI